MKLQKSLQLQDICQYRQKTLLFRSVCNNDLNCSGFMKKISKWNINGKKKALWVGFSSSVIECFLSKTSVNLQMDLFDNIYIYTYIPMKPHSICLPTPDIGQKTMFHHFPQLRGSGQYGHSAKWLEALRLLQRMQRRGPRPNVISYNATWASTQRSLEWLWRTGRRWMT